MEDMILNVLADITKTAKSTIMAQINEGVAEGEKPTESKVKSVIGQLYKAKLDGQYKRGQLETATKFEKELKAIEGFSSDKQGTDLISDLSTYTKTIAAAGKKEGEMTPEEMLKHPAVVAALNDGKNSVKEAWEKKLQEETGTYKTKVKELQKTTIYGHIEQTLIEAGAKVLDADGKFDQKKRRAIRKLADTMNFQPTKDGLKILDSDGNEKLDEFGNKEDAKKVVLSELNFWGLKDARENRSGAGSGSGGGSKEETKGVHNFKSDQEYAKYMTRMDIKIEDKRAAKTEWEKQQAEKKED